MIVLLALFLGAGFGAWRARKRGGNRLDMAQYAAAHGIAFALAGLLLTLVIGRLV